MAIQPTTGAGGVERSQESGLADVVTTILDKGVVIDIFARVSLVGIELLRVDARVVIASVDTYLRFAEAADRLQMGSQEPKDLMGVVEGVSESGSKGKTKGAIEAGVDKLGDMLQSSEEKEKEPAQERKGSDK
jgi:gas vesicle structural protein